MIRKSQLFLAVAALVGMNAAMAACNTTQWGQGAVTAVVGAPIADGPVNSDANVAITHRYSGKCALRSTASGNYVQDGSPLAEASYISRFYVSAAVTGGEADIFVAMADETVDYPIFKITYDGSGASPVFKFYPGNGAGGFGAAQTITQANSAPLAASRWYMIETDYKRNSGTTGGTLAVSLLGGRGVGQLNGTTASTATLAAGTMTLADAGDGVDYIRLGWAGGTGTGQVNVDAFESRRSTTIGSLKRGDANNNGTCTAGDGTQILLDVNAITGNNEAGLVLGQADANESGTVTASDKTTLLNIVNADTASGGTRVCGMPIAP